MATSQPRRGSAGDSDLLLAWAIPAVAVLLAAASSVVWLAEAVDDERAGRPLPGNPFRLARTVVRDPAARPSTVGWVVAGVLVVVPVVAIIVLMLRIVGRMRRGRVAVDRLARHLGRGRDLEPLTGAAVTATARRLGSQTGRLPGTVLGRAVSGGQTLYASCEDTVVVMAGPRTRKSSGWGIPTVLDAPGAVVYTSNKTDDVALMRRVRPGLVFDPQGLTGETPGFWWDPLSYVVDDTTAEQLAGHFADDARNPAANRDAYFDPEGRNLLAWLLLAAAVDRRPITAVTDWLADSHDSTPAGLLEHDYPQLARRLDGILNLPDKQRAGVYGTASKMASCLTNSRVAAWITRPPRGARRAHFDPAGFVAGGDVLYSLSREGAGSAGALVTALTVAVCEAAEELAVRSPGGRLPVPLTAVLDEAANVCRWKELPNLYSHYGSRGIALLTFLQAPEQAEEVWGANGAGLLWSAANHRIYAGGVANRKWLADLSELIGTYDAPTLTTTDGRGGRSTNHGTRREPVLSVADLAALRKGRAVLLSTGAPATLVTSVTWRDGPHAATLSAQQPVDLRAPAVLRSDPIPSAAPDAAAAAVSAAARRWVHPARMGPPR